MQKSDSPKQVLEFIRDNPECTIAEIAAATALSTQTVGLIARTFEYLGYATRLDDSWKSRRGKGAAPDRWSVALKANGVVGVGDVTAAAQSLHARRGKIVEPCFAHGTAIDFRELGQLLVDRRVERGDADCGMTVREIAEHYGVTYPTALRAARELLRSWQKIAERPRVKREIVRWVHGRPEYARGAAPRELYHDGSEWRTDRATGKLVRVT